MSHFNLRKAALVILAVFSFILSLDCSKNNPVNPKTEEPQKPLEFTWKVDTIVTPRGFYTTDRKIWGSSPTDVWIIGFNTSYMGEIYRFDGKSWNRMTPNFELNADYKDMMGFSSDNIYFAGYTWATTGINSTRFNTLIVHYDGNSFVKVPIPTSEGVLTHIWGRNPRDIWACGTKGLLYHFDGVNWTLMKQNTGVDLGPIFGTGESDVYMVSESNDYKLIDSLHGASTVYFSTLESGNWVVKDSCRLHVESGVSYGYTFGRNSMWGTSRTELYSIVDRIYKYDGMKWNVNGWVYNEVKDIRGTGPDDIYVVGMHGYISHFDGKQWKSIREYEDTIANFFSVQPFKNEIFILVYYLGDAYVVRGIKKS